MSDLITPPSSQQYEAKIQQPEDEEVTILKHEILPPTPPRDREDYPIEERKVTNKIKKQPQKRKPKLKYRPPNGTVLNINDYDPELPMIEQDDDIDFEDVGFLHYALTHSKKIAIITGAGISVASGIPDFRSSNGLFQGLKATTSAGSNGKALFDSSVYGDSESTSKFHAMIKQLYHMTNKSHPTKFHKMMNSLSQDGRLLRHYTQNIDCLEMQLPHLQTIVPIKQKPPYPPTIQLHGSIRHMYCSKCRWNSDFKPRLFKDDEPPMCPECLELEEIRRISGKRSQGIGCLRPRIVLYNEFHPDGENIGNISALDLKSKPDCLIIAGTSLKIPGVRRLVKELAKAVHATKGCIIWVNKDEPSMSIVDYIDYIDLIVTGDCQDIPSIVENYQKCVTSGKKLKFKKHNTPPSKVKKEPKVIKDEKQNLIQARLEQLVSHINKTK